jgi:alkanesulfonate monooxygenase SsuD/methylene tetrahydromethanopterin reductase-like flavin-dependent oxidoreductase (luciferase family)
MVARRSEVRGVGLTIPPEEDVVAFARRVETSGADYLACGEHVLGGPTRNAFVALAAAAAVTERVELVSTVSLVPLYPAALLARMALTLDGVSSGRFHLGVGVGTGNAELIACGADPSQRGTSTTRKLEIIDALLRGRDVDCHDGPVQLEGARLLPTAIRRPRPLLWMGGRGPQAERRAATFGDVWMPYFLDDTRFAASITRIDEMSAAAGRASRPIPVLFAFVTVGEHSRAAHATAAAELSRMYGRDMTQAASRYAIAGTADECLHRFNAFRASGARAFIVTLVCQPDTAREMFDRFAVSCLPSLRGPES